METELENAILGHLEEGFERDFFSAAIKNVDDLSNSLRLNNFAYAMRELIRNVLERIAPDEEVTKAPWFKPSDKEHPEKVIRAQRIKYAIQGWLSDDYIINNLNIDHEDDDKKLRDNIDILSKYTHITKDTFNIESTKVTEIALDVLNNVLLFFMNVQDAKQKVRQAAIDFIDEEMVEGFYYNTQNAIDVLATHHEVLAYYVSEINLIDQGDEYINMKVTGNVKIRLQYGSDGDIRRDEGWVTEMKFPFTSNLVASYKNAKGDVHIISSKINVDTEEFYS